MLDEGDEFLRGEALRVLVGWLHDERYVARALEVVGNCDQPGYDVLAMTCAGALAEYVRQTGAARELVLHELVQALRRSTAPDVQRALYEGCLVIVENDPLPYVPRHFVPGRDIDWKRLH